MWVLSCLANWHVNTESGVSENKVKVERVSGSKNSLCISQTHCLICFFIFYFLESVPEGFGTIIHSAGHSPWTTHPEGGHTSYYGLKGQKERRMREQPSRVPISSSSPVSGTPSRLPPPQRKTDM